MNWLMYHLGYLLSRVADKRVEWRESFRHGRRQHHTTKRRRGL